jgi:hypothetical protein
MFLNVRTNPTEIFLILGTILQISHIYIGIHVKYKLFLSDFNQTWVFSTEH